MVYLMEMEGDDVKELIQTEEIMRSVYASVLLSGLSAEEEAMDVSSTQTRSLLGGYL